MNITINYKAKNGIANLMKKAREFGKENGVKVQGDDSSGTVTKGGLLPVKGTYTIKGENIILEVTQIPFLISEGTAKSEILKWLEQNDIK